MEENIYFAPESAPDLHRLMKYYLPTTQKLVDTYATLDKQKIQGENMTRSTMDIVEMWCVMENIFLAATNEGLSCAMRIPHRDQPRQVLDAVGCPEGYQLLCMIGIGYAAEDAEYPTQTYPEPSKCIHWNRW